MVVLFAETIELKSIEEEQASVTKESFADIGKVAPHDKTKELLFAVVVVMLVVGKTIRLLLKLWGNLHGAFCI
jgi:ethanolamine ammonia-lyase small subunit